jgi:hypothetical protein
MGMWTGLVWPRMETALVNSLLNLRVSWNAGKLSSGLTSRGLSSSVQLHRVSYLVIIIIIIIIIIILCKQRSFSIFFFSLIIALLYSCWLWLATGCWGQQLKQRIQLNCYPQKRFSPCCGNTLWTLVVMTLVKVESLNVSSRRKNSAALFFRWPYKQTQLPSPLDTVNWTEDIPFAIIAFSLWPVSQPDVYPQLLSSTTTASCEGQCIS